MVYELFDKITGLVVVSVVGQSGCLRVTCNDFHTIDGPELAQLLEVDVVQHKRPNVVAEAVGVQLLSLEVQLRLDSAE